MQIEKYKIDEYNQSLLKEHKRKLDFISSEIKDVESVLQKLIDFQVAIPSWALGTGGTRFARFGLLFLRKGKWKDQQLISEKWVNAVHQPSPANKSYGYMWWTNLENKMQGVPGSVYSAEGFGGNYIIIDNEHDLVVVVRWIESDKIGELMNLIIKSIENNK